MSKRISAVTAAFLDEVRPVIVGTRRTSGVVKMNPAWYEFRDGRFWLNSWRGAHWLDQVERDQRATLLFIDGGDMYRTVHVDAVLIRTTAEGADDHLDRLSVRYRGEPYQRRSRIPQQRVILELEPTRVRSSLDWRAG